MPRGCPRFLAAALLLALLAGPLSGAHPGHPDTPERSSSSAGRAQPPPQEEPPPAPSPWKGPVQPGPWPPPANETANGTARGVATPAARYEPPAGSAHEWVGFKSDPQRTGASPGRAPAAPEVRWNAPGQAGYGIAAEPVVAHNLVMIADLGRQVRAVALANGFPQWTTTVPDRVLAGLAVDDDTLVVGCLGGQVVGLHVLTGAARWNYTLGQRISAAPLVVNGLVYVVGDGGRVAALEGPSGQERWRVDLRPVDGGVAPMLLAGKLIVGQQDGHVVALQPLTGATLWSSRVGPFVTATPVGALGRIIVPHLGLSALDPATGRVVWTQASTAPVRSSPAFAQGTLVYGDPEAPGLVGADAFTGAVRWRAPMVTLVQTAPVIASDTAIAAALDGTVGAFRLHNGSALWTADAGERVRAGLVALDGRVLASRVDGTVRMLADPGAAAAPETPRAAADGLGNILGLLPVFAAIAAPYLAVKRVHERMQRQARAAAPRPADAAAPDPSPPPPPARTAEGGVRVACPRCDCRFGVRPRHQAVVVCPGCGARSVVQRRARDEGAA